MPLFRCFMKDSERDMKTLNMFQGVDIFHLLKMWKWLHQFVNWWPETIACPWNYWKISCILTGRQFIGFLIKVWETEICAKLHIVPLLFCLCWYSAMIVRCFLQLTAWWSASHLIHLTSFQQTFTYSLQLRAPQKKISERHWHQECNRSSSVCLQWLFCAACGKPSGVCFSQERSL